jgi:exosortase H (IPTLxxWG-CTERM-specific)
MSSGDGIRRRQGGQRGTRPGQAGPPARPRASRAALRSVLLFFAVFGALHAAFQFAGNDLVDVATRWTAETTAWALSLLGAAGRTEGTIVYSSVFAIDVILECTAIFPVALYFSAVVATPDSITSKLVGLAVGIPAILLLNLIRLVSLCYIGYWFPESFDTAHHLVWQSLIVFFTALVWIGWVMHSSTSHAQTAQSA